MATLESRNSKNPKQIHQKGQLETTNQKGENVTER